MFLFYLFYPFDLGILIGIINSQIQKAQIDKEKYVLCFNTKCEFYTDLLSRISSCLKLLGQKRSRFALTKRKKSEQKRTQGYSLWSPEMCPDPCT